MVPLDKLPRMEPVQEKGYTIVRIKGNVDNDIYSNNKGEGSFLTNFTGYLKSVEGPIALDVSESDMHYTPALGLFVEAFKITKRKVPVVYRDGRFIKGLRSTHIDQYVDLYKSIGELPEIISSQSGQAAPEGPQAAHEGYSPQ